MFLICGVWHRMWTLLTNAWIVLVKRYYLYIYEQKVPKFCEAAVLADEHVLPHRDTFDKFSPNSSHPSSTFPEVPVLCLNLVWLQRWNPMEVQFWETCQFVHTVRQMDNCFLLQKKSKSFKAVVLVKTPPLPGLTATEEQSELELYSPFVMQGFVSVRWTSKCAHHCFEGYSSITLCYSRNWLWQRKALLILAR